MCKVNNYCGKPTYFYLKRSVNLLNSHLLVLITPIYEISRLHIKKTFANVKFLFVSIKNPSFPYPKMLKSYFRYNFAKGGYKKSLELYFLCY